MKPSREAIIVEIRHRFMDAKTDLNETKHDIRTPGFNQNLGRHDALGELLEWIEDQENES